MFEECIEALGAISLSHYESEEIEAILRSDYPLSFCGYIDWGMIHNKIDIGQDYSQIKPILEKLLQGSFDTSVYLAWRDDGFPVKTDLNSIIENYEKVDWFGHKFIFNPALGSIIEIQRSGKIIVGVIPVLQPMSIRFQQKIMELGGVRVSLEQARLLEECVISKIPFTRNAIDWGRIRHDSNWHSEDRNHLIRYILTRTRYNALNESIYIEWIDNGSTHKIIQGTLTSFLSYFNSLLQAPSNKLLLNPCSGSIIEMRSSGIVRFGSMALPADFLDTFKKRVIERGVESLSPEEINHINEHFIAKIPRISGTIDWNSMRQDRYMTPDNFFRIYAQGLVPARNSPVIDQALYFYDTNNHMIQTTLKAVSQFLQEVRCVTFNTYLFNPIDNYLVEFKSNGTILSGLFSHEKSQR